MKNVFGNQVMKQQPSDKSWPRISRRHWGRSGSCKTAWCPVRPAAQALEDVA